MRFALVLAAALCACKPDPFRPDAGPLDSPPVDAYNPPWWTPEPGEIASFDVQLGGYDFATQRGMYIVELWDVVPSARMIDYGDGSPVSVPAGSQATAIATLHATTPKTMVICHINTGALRLTDPDAMKFPGYEPNPPNRPTMPAANSVIGWSTTETDANERWLDLRTAGRARWQELMWKRLDLAKEIGCDGIAADRNDAIAYESSSGTGFGPISIPEHQSWHAEVAKQAHDRELSAGHRGGTTISDQVGLLAKEYDWFWPDRCAEYDECDQFKQFLDFNKAVFAVDYNMTEDGNALSKTVVCARWDQANLKDGVIKSAALDGSFTEECP